MSDWNAETAEWYAEKYGDYPTNRLAVDELNLPVDAVIVDIGCGTGSALRHAAPRVPHGRLIGVDPVPRMIEIAEAQTAGHDHAARIEFREGCAEDVLVDDMAADFVLAFDSLDHWTNAAAGLREVGRVLRSDGTFVVVKDGTVPGVTEARRTLPDALGRAGFVITEHRRCHDEGIEFDLWLCHIDHDPGAGPAAS